MHQQIPEDARMMTFIIPLVVIGLVILRNSRARRLRIETLWIAPLMILLLVGLSLSQEGMPSTLGLAADAAALTGGALLGWWRARFTQITIDPASHELTSRASPLGMLVILAVFAVRYGLRMYAVQDAGAIGLPVNVVADAALVLTIGLVCAQRFEIFTRASRMLAEARASSPT
jgi:hypothetical protein